jgi:agmatinase
MPDNKSFDPNAVGKKGSIFGLPFGYDESAIIVIPVPWDVTVSYREGTSLAPAQLLSNSSQIDYYQEDIPDAWKMGIYYDDSLLSLEKKNKKLRKAAKRFITKLEEGSRLDFEDRKSLKKINQAGETIREKVRYKAGEVLGDGKIPIVLGGEHSVPLGNIEAAAEVSMEGISILQLDAHADLRKGYEGFTYSHASIMYNALQHLRVRKLIQVGIRDFCEEEKDMIVNDQRITCFTDLQIKERLYGGSSWKELCGKIIEKVGHEVYISFDIDCLEPQYCPNTGTPVPGGLSFEMANYLIKQLVKSGKKVIGGDLCEVGASDNEWDAIVGARLLYRMSLLMGCSQDFAELK